MDPVIFRHAYYVKLGRGGEWEERSIKEGRIRIGWRYLTLEDIHTWREEKIREKTRLRREQEGLPPNKAAVAKECNALKLIVRSTPEDVWITFHASHLWWCRVAEDGVREDEISRYRRVIDKWSNTDAEGNPLVTNQIPGSIARLQRFQGTICRVRAADDLRRLLNKQASEVSRAISEAKKALVARVGQGLKRLHWKDFETLVDLIFRDAGWHRISSVGKSMKYVDMELKEPITGELYQVQVKSAATARVFADYAEKFSRGTFRKLYFVIHTPEGEDWGSLPTYPDVELILPDRLAEMIVDAGLTNWLLNKIS